MRLVALSTSAAARALGGDVVMLAGNELVVEVPVSQADACLAALAEQRSVPDAVAGLVRIVVSLPARDS